MNVIKPIETEYKGYRFRSRLEARWAVFFDACRVDWEYEPEGYDLGDGLWYLPDFLLHGVAGRDSGDLFVEVKGLMTEEDAEKIRRFVEGGGRFPKKAKYRNALLVVDRIPEGDSADDIGWYISCHGYDIIGGGISPFNFETIDGDYFAAHPGINNEGRFELFGDDSNYLAYQDDAATVNAYRIARQARFEHGQAPSGRRRW